MSASPPPRPPGVLLVDDEPSVRDVLRIALGQVGFRVWAAASGAMAVALFEANRAGIDVALLDVRLPGMDGPQTMAALRRLEPGLPCCFMSGSLGERGRQSLRAAGARHVFAKPLDLDEVARVLREVAAEAAP
jgi:CheY-like chemotaxis protein